jgi:transposase-like protein
MVAVALKCPFCGSEDVRPYGTSNGKKRYAGNNPACSHKTFYAEYCYNGSKPDVRTCSISLQNSKADVYRNKTTEKAETV